MLILICGEDNFRSREYLRELISRFKQKFDGYGRNITFFFDDASAAAEARSAISSPPFLAERRLAVFDGALGALSKDPSAERIFDAVPESTICAVYEDCGESELKKNALAAILMKKKELKKYVFSELDSKELERWIRGRGKKLGLNFGQGAVMELAARVGPDLWQISGELEKFAAVGGEITAERVQREVHGAVSENIFNFIDAVLRRDGKQALQELDALRRAGAAVPYLFTMIYREIRMMIAARAWIEANPGAAPAKLAGEMKWHPFAAKKTLAAAQEFSLRDLDRALSMLFRSAMNQRTGIMDEKSAFDLFVAQFILYLPEEARGIRKISAGSRGSRG